MTQRAQSEHQTTRQAAVADALAAFTPSSFQDLQSPKRRFFRSVRRQVPRVVL